MFKLLNRFAWILSLSFGFIIAFIIIGSNGYRINGEEVFGSGVFGLFVGFIIKKILFSENFIKSRLEFFANSLKENYLEKKDIINNNSPVIPFHKGDEDINLENKNIGQEISDQKETIDLAEIEEQERINEIKKLEEKKELEKQKLETKTEEEIEKIIDLKNSEKYIKDEEIAVEVFFEKIGNYIKEFFSTNLLAKLGGILVFLAVVYFLKGFVGDLWEIIGPVGRITTGIIIGFAIYFAGVKLHPKYENEGLVLIGTGILINYAVILAGRYLVGDGGYLTETTTFLFLILNTIFGVTTSLVYKSKTLLIFSFIFAYLNPFIIGAKSNGQPYTLIGYSLIVSLGGLFIAKKQTNLTLIIISFILGNLLFLVAPFSDSLGWSAKIILTSILSVLTIVLADKFEFNNNLYKGLKPSVNKLIIYLFSGTYLFIILNLLNSGNILGENFSFVVYNIILVGLFGFSIKLIKNSPIIPFNKGDENDSFSSLNFFLFLPLIILIGILFSGNLIFSPFVLVATIILYLIAFSFLQLATIFSYVFFGVLAIFILLFNVHLVYLDNLLNIEFISILITSLIFLFSSYYYSFKKGLVNLFPVGTIGTILILSPIIKNSGNFMSFSVLAIIIFAIANLVLPVLNLKLLKKENLNSLIIGSLAGVLFFAFQIYNFGEIHFPGVTEGFVFLGLAIVYFIEGYFVANKIGFKNMKTDTSLQNSFFSFIGISISLFSVAIAFVFSNYPEIITTTWLFEATILYFFYSRNSNIKIFYAATILFIIGLTKFGILTSVVKSRDYYFLISFGVILASFMLNLFFINKVEINKKDSTRVFSSLGFHNIHHIFHIIGMGIMGILLLEIIPSTGNGWSLFGISIFITILGSFYAKFNFKFLKIFFLFLVAGFGILHIGELNHIFWRLENRNLEYLKILQYIVFVIIISNIFIWKKLNAPLPSSPLTGERSQLYNKRLLIIISIYVFIISNLFAIDLFEDIFGSFTLTIYWGLIASILLIIGIQKNIIKYRTIGLYFLTLTSAKIFLFDVWQIGDTNARILVFGILGIIFIIISTLYTKRFGDNLLGEFSFDNLGFTNNLKEKSPKKEQTNKNSPIIPFHKGDENIKEEEKQEKQQNNFGINEEIERVDVSDIKSVKFIFSDNKKVNIRAINLLKIVKMIIDNLDGKTSFKPEELRETYEYIKQNYKTNLSKNNYDKIIEILEKFVKQGGSVELIKK